MNRFIILIAAMLIATALSAPVASSQVEIYASDPAGTPADFLFGRVNNVSLRGTVDAPTGGETLKVRQIDAALSCPSALGTEVPVDFTFNAWVPAGNPVMVPNVTAGVSSARRDSKFCIYAYFQNNALGEANPNVTYSQVVHFRDPPPPNVAINRVFATSSTGRADRPYFIVSGINETLGGEAIAFVKQPRACPGTFQGGAGAVTFADASGANFTRFGIVPVGIGFWRVCAYTITGGGSALGGSATFSRAPKGGWKPKYSLARGSTKLKSGRIALGSVKCPGPCEVSVTASVRGKTVATGSTAGRGKLRISLKAGKAVRRGKKTRFKITTTIDQSTASKTVELRLR